MAVIDIRGEIIDDADAWIYDYFNEVYTCPAHVRDAVKAAKEGETIDVFINSFGGSVSAGQEIYDVLSSNPNVRIKIQSQAFSAASIIAMAGYCEMNPVATMMVHNVSMWGASGDYHDMEKASEMLHAMDESMANAYAKKSGKPLEECVAMMDRETWLSANQCLEMGLIDKISDYGANPSYTNAFLGSRMTEEKRARAFAEKAKKEAEEELKNEILKDIDSYVI